MSISIQRAVDIIVMIDALNGQIARLLYECHNSSWNSRKDNVRSIIRTMSNLKHKETLTTEINIVYRCKILLDTMDELIQEAADSGCHDLKSIMEASMNRACFNYKADSKIADEIAKIFAHLLDLTTETETQK